jgi:hypothetical protein
MHHQNALSPDRMSNADRTAEVAHLLALGVLRLLQTTDFASHDHPRNGDISLDFIGRQSVHTDVSTTTGNVSDE